jgi:hypothetical protein
MRKRNTFTKFKKVASDNLLTPERLTEYSADQLFKISMAFPKDASVELALLMTNKLPSVKTAIPLLKAKYKYKPSTKFIEMIDKVFSGGSYSTSLDLLEAKGLVSTYTSLRFLQKDKERAPHKLKTINLMEQVLPMKIKSLSTAEMVTLAQHNIKKFDFQKQLAQEIALRREFLTPDHQVKCLIAFIRAEDPEILQCIEEII